MTLASTSTATIGEMREFASFTAQEQRYIKRSLDIGLARGDAFKMWGHSADDSASIRRQYVVYQDLKSARAAQPKHQTITEVERFVSQLLRLAAFDLQQEKLESFSAFRFLYERLLGPEARPYLPSVFCAAAALPSIRPAQRKVLLQSLSEAAATAPGWSNRAPAFYPEFVEDVEAA
ncbi:MAG: hypothetical protein AAFR32_00090 [Pseudomonadota bacterium]